MTAAAPPSEGTTASAVLAEDFPSLDLALDELRVVYAEEAAREQSFTARADLMLATAGAVLAVLAIAPVQRSLLQGVAMCGLAATVGLSLWATRIRIYLRPHGPPLDFYRYARLPPVQARDQFMLDYVAAIEGRAVQNDRAVLIVRASTWALLLSLLCLGAEYARQAIP